MKKGGVREEEKDLHYSSHDKAVDGHMSPLGINGVCLRKVNWWRNVLHLPSHCKKETIKGRKEGGGGGGGGEGKMTGEKKRKEKHKNKSRRIIS